MKAFYAGSFNPFTIGHKWIADRALEMFGSLVIGIGVNQLKGHLEDLENRLLSIKELYKDNPEVTVIGYEGLTAEIARENGAGVLVRGVRNPMDFEKEKELADINLKVLGLPTVFIPSPPDLSFISSSMVRELSHFGYDASDFVAGAKREIRKV